MENKTRERYGFDVGDKYQVNHFDGSKENIEIKKIINNEVLAKADSERRSHRVDEEEIRQFINDGIWIPIKEK